AAPDRLTAREAAEEAVLGDPGAQALEVQARLARHPARDVGQGHYAGAAGGELAGDHRPHLAEALDRDPLAAKLPAQVLEQGLDREDHAEAGGGGAPGRAAERL